MKTHVRTHLLVLALVGTALATAPTRAAGQEVTTVSGRVTNESGVGINDARVFVLADVAATPRPGERVTIQPVAETRTSTNGAFTIKIPVGSDKKYFELRVRAEGYAWDTRTLPVSATPIDENFRLKVDPVASKRVEMAGPGGVAKMYGKVTTDAGVGIDSAQVYINNLSVMVYTNSSGEYSFDTPARGQMENLRVRKTGYPPDVRMVWMGAGAVENNFVLRGDARALSEVPVAARAAGARGPQAQGGTEPARVAPVLKIPLTASAAAMQGDPFGRNLFTAEQVMQNQDALALKESQRSELQRAVETAQVQSVKLQWALALDTEKLAKMLSSVSLDEKEVLAQTDRVMAIEREIKRAQMLLMIKIKNTLSAEQQTKLRQLR